MPQILYIDTSQSFGVIALFANKTLLDSLMFPGKEQTRELIPKIDELLCAHKTSLKELDAIGVCNGPGSFTGTRIGLITAKTFSFALKLPLIAIDAFIPYTLASKIPLLALKKDLFLAKTEGKIEKITSLDHEKKYSSPHKEMLEPLFNDFFIEKTEYCLHRIGLELMKKWEEKEFSDPKMLNALYGELF